MCILDSDEAESGCLGHGEGEEAECGCLGQGEEDVAVSGCYNQGEEDEGEFDFLELVEEDETESGCLGHHWLWWLVLTINLMKLRTYTPRKFFHAFACLTMCLYTNI